MKDDITGLVFCGIIFIFIFGISMLLRSGRGEWLLNFYLFMPKEKKALYNAPALCRYFGNILLIADIYLIFCLGAALFEITWLIILLTVILICICITATIYAYTDPKFRNHSNDISAK